MTRIFIYEFITGGGLLEHDSLSTRDSLQREGWAMLRGLAADFASLPDTEVVYLKDHRFEENDVPGCSPRIVCNSKEARAALASCAADCDWSVVIAPEFNDLLLASCRQVESAGGRLLGPSPEIVALAGDKQRTAEHLAAAGVSVPPGVALEPGQAIPADFTYPAVLKPQFGAGSHEVYLIPIRGQAKDFQTQKFLSVARRLERYCPGIPTSVATLCGPSGNVCLAPCRQQLSDDGRFHYEGGSLPLRCDLVERATRLASQAIATLPQPLGYVGIDMVLGEDGSGDHDVVIEINPRLTTSYVGLRVAAKRNLAGAMLDVAQGRQAIVEFDSGPLHFYADGTVERVSH